MNFARDQFLARAAFAQDQNRSFGGSDEIDLINDVAQFLALADQVPEGLGFHHFFLQISVLHLVLHIEALNFLESARVDQGVSDVIGDNLPPRPQFFARIFTTESIDDSQKFRL